MISKVCLLLLVGTYLALAQGNGCTSPILQRTEVQARFGGSGNILKTAVTASTGLPICKFLAGKEVCVSNDGFGNFRSWFDGWKNDMVSNGQSRNYAKFNQLNNEIVTNATDCVEKYIYWSAFVGYSVAAQVQTSNNIDYTNLNSVAQQTVSVQLSNIMNGANSPATLFSQVDAIRRDTVVQKAACAKVAFKHMIFATCTAALSNWTSNIGSTSAAPILYVKTGYCTEVKSACVNYFTDLKLVGQISLIFGVCTNNDAATVTSILKGQGSSSNNPTLNSIWQNNKGSYPSTASVTTPKVAPNMQCDNQTQSAADCNFICNSVLTGSGFKANAFNDLDASAKRRMLQSVDDNGAGSVMESDDAAVPDPNEVISDDEVGMVRAEAEIGTSAHKLFLSAFALLAVIFAALL